jgi:mono/diheme cytochrome c family protein
VDLGRAAYYYNCMPCHGDRGQGLTDAWRQVWEADHQDCWARGCHGGLPSDEGFPIPQTIPAIIGVPAARAYDEEALLRYLRETHPPQRPGALSDEEYAQLTAFLLAENGVAAESTGAGPQAAGIAGLLIVCLAGLAGWLVWQRRHGAKPA